MVYATYSTGFRPGGVNRVYDKHISAIYPPYQSDELKNYEIGWKTQWFDEHLRWNGALFWEDWNNFQFSYLGPNSVTVVQNAAAARSRGVETNFEWLVGSGWVISGSATFLDAVADEEFLRHDHVDLPDQLPDSGQRLGKLADFLRGWNDDDRAVRGLRHAAARHAATQDQSDRPLQLFHRGLERLRSAGLCLPGRVRAAAVPDVLPKWAGRPTASR